MTIALTGHRPKYYGPEYNMHFKEYGPVTKWIYREIEAYYKALEPDVVITGMALGFDMIGATACLRMDIPFIAAIPFPGQEKKWGQSTQYLYKQMLERAKDFHFICDRYQPDAFDKRNQWMVDQLTAPEDRVLSLYDGKSPGGTYNCLEYARSRNKEIITFFPNIK